LEQFLDLKNLVKMHNVNNSVWYKYICVHSLVPLLYTEEYVYSAVRTETLHTINVNLSLARKRYVIQDSFDASRSGYKINNHANIQLNTTVYLA
jgi:hypothetical protein